MITDEMKTLMAKMATAKQPPGYVIFAVRTPVPVPLPTVGRPEGSRAGAEQKARELLAGPLFSRAWVVGRDGITEVLADAAQDETAR